jgi:hypothetical protein
MKLRLCKYCGLEKDEGTEFYPGKLYPSSHCIECEKTRAKKVANDRYADPVKKEKIQLKRKVRESADEVRELIRSHDRLRYKNLRETDSVFVSARGSQYFQKNKKQIYVRVNRRLHENPSIKLRKWVSGRIWTALRSQGGSKRGFSVMDFLPYTIEELRAHIESLWEPWMSWDNHGRWREDECTWQIDHIIPQVLLPFDDFTNPNFLRCWALSNLRPLESIENLRKGHRLF